jgi:Ca2+-binding EF-hand superfamily protein
MQKACWQDESEVFDDGPATNYVRNRPPWEQHSLTSVELREEDEKHRNAANVKVQALWAPPSEADLQAQFDKELEAQEYQFATPWDQVRPGDNKEKMIFDAQLRDDKNMSYKYDALWSAPEMTASQLEQLACYEMNAPFERDGDIPDIDPKLIAKRAELASAPRTIAPWKYGQEQGPPIREKKRTKETALWANLEPKSKQNYNLSIPSSGDPILDTVREKLLNRSHNIVGLSKRFKLMDSDRSGTLDLTEFRKGMKECQVGVTDMQIKHIFNIFDQDGNGFIGYDEFLVGLRGQLNSRRIALVRMAFRRMDKDGSGIIDMSDIKAYYNAKGHPDVIQKFRTENEILREILDAFDGGLGKSLPSKDKNKSKNIKGDGIVTLDEFCEYYANISASIDDDDYFELMIRNAWHLSGGKGWSANTTNARVLVTHSDGTQTIEEAKGDPMSNDYSKSFGVGGDTQSRAANMISRHQEDISTIQAVSNEGHYYQLPNSARSTSSAPLIPGSRAPIAGLSTEVLNERTAPGSARRASHSSQGSHHSKQNAPQYRGGGSGSGEFQYALGAGPTANEAPDNFRPAKQMGGINVGHIRGLPQKSSWTATPGAAAAATNRVLTDIQNSNSAPTSLGAALAAAKNDEGYRQQPPSRQELQRQQARAVTNSGPQRGVSAMAARPPPRADPYANAGKNIPPSYSKEQLADAAARNKAPRSLREQLMGGQ